MLIKDVDLGEEIAQIRQNVRKLCDGFSGEYWRALDRESGYPSAFVHALTEAGYLSVLIPEEYGGSGLKLSAAAAILEEIQRAGANGAACHGQMYMMGALLRHGYAGAEAHATCPASPAASYASRRLASPSPPAGPTPPPSRPSRGVTATAMS